MNKASLPDAPCALSTAAQSPDLKRKIMLARKTWKWRQQGENINGSRNWTGLREVQQRAKYQVTNKRGGETKQESKRENQCLAITVTLAMINEALRWNAGSVAGHSDDQVAYNRTQWILGRRGNLPPWNPERENQFAYWPFKTLLMEEISIVHG